MTNPNEQMPDNPGAPEATDDEYISPDQSETLAQEAAESEALAADDADPLSDSEVLDAELADALNDAEREVNPDADGDGTVSEAELQLAERTEDLQRVSAEYANYRRRTERERSQIANDAKAKVIEELLPLIDDLELARQHGDLADGPLKAFSDNLQAVLQRQKTQAFGAEGDAFRPGDPRGGPGLVAGRRENHRHRPAQGLPRRRPPDPQRDGHHRGPGGGLG